MYVRVKNRGTKTANNVVVKAYHCNPGSGLAWPDHWSPMDTPQLAASGSIPSGGQVVVGPFKWSPEVYGHECLLAIASAGADDPGNDTTVFGSIPHSRFVPFDNNIGQRNVHPVLVIDWKKIMEYVKKLPFQVVNPFKKVVKVELLPIMPKLLTDEKYWVFFNNPGGNKFELAPYETRKVVYSIVRQPRIPSRRPWEPLPIRPKPGIPKPEDMFDDDGPNSPEEFLSGRPIKFRIVTLIDGQNMGGMTYILEPQEGRLPIGVSDVSFEEKEERDINTIRETLESQPGVKRVRVRNMTVDIEFEE